MLKVLAIVFLILAIIFMVPHAEAREWFAPTPIPNGWWGSAFDISGRSAAMATPLDDRGMYRFDVWNAPTEYGRPITRDDIQVDY